MTAIALPRSIESPAARAAQYFKAGSHPSWGSSALGAWLGGNGALIGASANLVVAGFAERAGQPIGFVRFMRSRFVPMLLAAAIAHVHI